MSGGRLEWCDDGGDLVWLVVAVMVDDTNVMVVGGRW